MMRGTFRRVATAAFAALGLLVASITVWVERESAYVIERRMSLAAAPSNGARPLAVILYHPSRDAGFSDSLSGSIAVMLLEQGYDVDRVTMTRDTPRSWARASLLVVVSNTYWWTPDRPTLQYLDHVRWPAVPVLGVMGGAGATRRAERMLAQRLQGTGAQVLGTRSAWIFRPNDEARLDEPNRRVANEVVTSWILERISALRPTIGR